MGKNTLIRKKGSKNILIFSLALMTLTGFALTWGAHFLQAQTAYTIWNNSVTPAILSDSDTGAVELGLKFRADTAGSITGIRFYKAAANTGTHVGNLWSASGTLLASVTFTNETASGWQQMALASPVPIQANTTYVVSYHTNVGRYSANLSYFATSGVDNGPLHALAAGVDGPNGVYRYGSSSAFPNQTWQSANYWVDVVFETTTGPDTTPPTVSSVSPPSGFVGDRYRSQCYSDLQRGHGSGNNREQYR